MSNLQNLDLESVEALLQQQEENRADSKDRDRDEERHSKKKKKHRSRSRSRSHKKKSRKRSRTRSKSKSRKNKDSRSRRRSTSRERSRRDDRDSSRRRSKDRDGDKEKSKEKRDNKENNHKPKDDDEHIDLATIEARQNERIQKEEEERKKKEQKAVEEKITEAKKQLEEARRDDSTILMLNLHIKSTEREIYEFFNNNQCGKVRDIRVIRDPKSGKSKGVAYVEFYFLDSVNKAVAQSGKDLMGSKVRIMPSKAEINRTAAVAKNLKQTKGPEQQQSSTGGMRLLVSGLTDQLADIEEKDLRDLFAPFGDVDRVEILRDDVTGKSKGNAFLLFRNTGDAKRAMIELDGFVVNGKKIKVEPVQAGMAQMMQDNSGFDLDDESGGNYLQTAESKALLMQRLQRGDPNAMGIPGVDQPNPNAVREETPAPRPQYSLLPTNCILMSNMFDVNEVDLEKEPTYFVDLKEEIEEECRKYGDIDQVFIEATNEGNIWVKFREGRGASGAYQTLNNKFFSGRKIICSYVTENTFNTKFRSM